MGEELAKIIDEASNPLLTSSYAINDSNSTFKVKEINDTHIRETMSKRRASKRFVTDNISTMSANSLGTLPVTCDIDELQNPLPFKKMLLEGHMNSTVGISNTFPNS